MKITGFLSDTESSSATCPESVESLRLLFYLFKICLACLIIFLIEYLIRFRKPLLNNITKFKIFHFWVVIGGLLLFWGWVLFCFFELFIKYNL